MQIKPGFTDFRYYTSSLGGTQILVFIEYCLGKNPLHVTPKTTPNCKETYSWNTKNARDFSKTKDNLIYLYILGITLKFSTRKKLKVEITLLCGVVGHVMYIFQHVNINIHSCFQQKVLSQLLKLLLYYKIRAKSHVQ